MSEAAELLEEVKGILVFGLLFFIRVEILLLGEPKVSREILATVYVSICHSRIVIKYNK